jgi:hypothetical protein
MLKLRGLWREINPIECLLSAEAPKNALGYILAQDRVEGAIIHE